MTVNLVNIIELFFFLIKWTTLHGSGSFFSCYLFIFPSRSFLSWKKGDADFIRHQNGDGWRCEASIISHFNLKVQIAHCFTSTRCERTLKVLSIWCRTAKSRDAASSSLPSEGPEMPRWLLAIISASHMVPVPSTGNLRTRRRCQPVFSVVFVGDWSVSIGKWTLVGLNCVTFWRRLKILARPVSTASYRWLLALATGHRPALARVGKGSRRDQLVFFFKPADIIAIVW